MRLTAEEIEAGRSPRGGWTRATLAAWGVPWPPPKGWQQRLIHGDKPRKGEGKAVPPKAVLIGVTGAGNVIPPDKDWPPWEKGTA
jgi:hypothetical protein